MKKGIVNLNQSGDASSISPESYWLVRDWLLEYKHYADLDILRGLLNNSGKLYKFWNRVVSDARFYKKKPLLIAKQNYVPILVIVRAGSVLPGARAVPVITIKGWDADVYLLTDIERLVNPDTVYTRRVMIAE